MFSKLAAKFALIILMAAGLLFASGLAANAAPRTTPVTPAVSGALNNGKPYQAGYANSVKLYDSRACQPANKASNKQFGSARVWVQDAGGDGFGSISARATVSNLPQGSYDLLVVELSYDEANVVVTGCYGNPAPFTVGRRPCQPVSASQPMYNGLRLVQVLITKHGDAPTNSLAASAPFWASIAA